MTAFRATTALLLLTLGPAAAAPARAQAIEAAGPIGSVGWRDIAFSAAAPASTITGRVDSPRP